MDTTHLNLTLLPDVSTAQFWRNEVSVPTDSVWWKQWGNSPIIIWAAYAAGTVPASLYVVTNKRWRPISWTSRVLITYSFLNIFVHGFLGFYIVLQLTVYVDGKWEPDHREAVAFLIILLLNVWATVTIMRGIFMHGMMFTLSRAFHLKSVNGYAEEWADELVDQISSDFMDNDFDGDGPQLYWIQLFTRVLLSNLRFTRRDDIYERKFIHRKYAYLVDLHDFAMLVSVWAWRCLGNGQVERDDDTTSPARMDDLEELYQHTGTIGNADVTQTIGINLGRVVQALDRAVAMPIALVHADQFWQISEERNLRHGEPELFKSQGEILAWRMRSQSMRDEYGLGMYKPLHERVLKLDNIPEDEESLRFLLPLCSETLSALQMMITFMLGEKVVKQSNVLPLNNTFRGFMLVYDGDMASLHSGKLKHLSSISLRGAHGVLTAMMADTIMAWLWAPFAWLFWLLSWLLCALCSPTHWRTLRWTRPRFSPERFSRKALTEFIVEILRKGRAASARSGGQPEQPASLMSWVIKDRPLVGQGARESTWSPRPMDDVELTYRAFDPHRQSPAPAQAPQRWQSPPVGLGSGHAPDMFAQAADHQSSSTSPRQSHAVSEAREARVPPIGPQVTSDRSRELVFGDGTSGAVAPSHAISSSVAISVNSHGEKVTRRKRRRQGKPPRKKSDDQELKREAEKTPVPPLVAAYTSSILSVLLFAAMNPGDHSDHLEKLPQPHHPEHADERLADERLAMVGLTAMYEQVAQVHEEQAQNRSSNAHGTTSTGVPTKEMGEVCRWMLSYATWMLLYLGRHPKSSLDGLIEEATDCRAAERMLTRAQQERLRRFLFRFRDFAAQLCVDANVVSSDKVHLNVTYLAVVLAVLFSATFCSLQVTAAWRISNPELCSPERAGTPLAFTCPAWASDAVHVMTALHYAITAGREFLNQIPLFHHIFADHKWGVRLDQRAFRTWIAPDDFLEAADFKERVRDKPGESSPFKAITPYATAADAAPPHTRAKSTAIYSIQTSAPSRTQSSVQPLPAGGTLPAGSALHADNSEGVGDGNSQRKHGNVEVLPEAVAEWLRKRGPPIFNTQRYEIEDIYQGYGLRLGSQLVQSYRVLLDAMEGSLEAVVEDEARSASIESQMPNNQ